MGTRFGNGLKCNENELHKTKYWKQLMEMKLKHIPMGLVHTNEG